MKRLTLGALVLATACASPATSARMSASFTEAFTGLYVSQQQLLGRTDVSGPALKALSSCVRTGPARSGPGEDWTCTVQYVDGLTPLSQGFEVQVRADGCWKADGPPANQPALLLDPTDGRALTNPLAEFDGCLDPSW